jgi:uncharacterized cupredoxin-like copper-binding protein
VIRKLVFAAFAWTLATAAATAATTVIIKLGDPNDDKSMLMKVDKSTVRAGPVEFDVSNLSKGKVHEMVVVAIQSRVEKLPYDQQNDTVNELKIKDLGEASDLAPGATKTLKLDMKPGLYRHEMRADLTVTK